MLSVVVAVLALLGVGASVHHYMGEPYNAGFLRFPVVVGLHVVLGGIYLALAPFQLVRGIRERWLGYHRAAGRVLVSIGLVVGATAFFIGVVIPFSGWPERLVIGFFAIFYVSALSRAIACVRAGRIELHREWMIRAFAIGLSIATMRLIFIPLLVLTGQPTMEQAATFSILSFAISFSVHWAGAELWIRGTRAEAHA